MYMDINRMSFVADLGRTIVGESDVLVIALKWESWGEGVRLTKIDGETMALWRADGCYLLWTLGSGPATSIHQ